MTAKIKSQYKSIEDAFISNFKITAGDLLNKKALHIKISSKEQLQNLNSSQFRCPIKITESYKIKEPNFHVNLFKITAKYKSFINFPLSKNLKWNKLKLFTNHFELISYNNQNLNIQPLIKYNPLSRAYFKLYELIINYNLIDNKKENIRYAGLAEGPGGFVECFINYRNHDNIYYNDQFKDDVYCITLKSDDEYVPGWDKIDQFMSKIRHNKHIENVNLSLLYGADGTGNLYRRKNIEDFIEKSTKNGKMDLVTADGGLDYSTNFNYQEQMSLQLIFCEIVTALGILKKGGHFVIKIFDIHTNITLQYIYLLSNIFEEVIINKPYTSRPANSEKYIVCKNYLGFQPKNKTTDTEKSNSFYNMLLDIVDKWDIITQKGRYIDSIFAIKAPPYFKKNIMNYINYLSKLQIENILQTLLCRDFNKQQIDSLLRTQISHTLYWAICYNQPINYKSDFFKAFKS